jgi:hypothetical protein
VSIYAIDSRDYIVTFELSSIEDCPADLRLPPELGGFEAGLFLPRDDPDWFGRSAYPPRVVLVRERHLHVIAHPSAAEPHWECPLEDLVAVEAGHMLLKGWFRFTGCAFDKILWFNMRGYRAVSRFICQFRQRWLGEPEADPATNRTAAGDPELGVKFGNALSAELDRGETSRSLLFQPSRAFRRRRWFLPRVRRTPSDLVALTGRRLLWISDRDRTSYAPYGTVTSSMRLNRVAGANVISTADGCTLEIRTAAGITWNIPLAGDRRDETDAFASELNSIAPVPESGPCCRSAAERT